MSIFLLLQNLGSLAGQLGQLRKCSWLQLVYLFGIALTAGAGWLDHQHCLEAMCIAQSAGVAAGAIVIQLPHVLSPKPGTVSLPDDHPLAPAVKEAANHAVVDRNRHQLDLD